MAKRSYFVSDLKLPTTKFVTLSGPATRTAQGDPANPYSEVICFLLHSRMRWKERTVSLRESLTKAVLG